MSYVITRRRVIPFRGLGATAQQVAGIASSVGSPIGAAVGGSSLAAATGLSLGLAVPIVGAALAGVTLAVMHFIQNSGCGPTCVITSQYANQATSLFAQNLGAYLDLPMPHSKSAQQAALANFDAIWAWLEQVCGQPGTGNAGVRCIQNQQRGSCPLKVSAFGWQQNADGSWFYQKNGPSGSGSNCWNYFSGFRDPIANDPTVVSDAQAAAPASSILGSLSGGSSLLPLLAIGGLVAVGAYLL